MVYKYSMHLLALSIAILWLPVAASHAASLDFINLLDNVVQKQPEQRLTKGIKAVYSANQSFSDSWISGDVDLIIHHENDAISDNDDYQNWQVGVEFPVWLPEQKKAQKQVTISYGQELPAQQNYLRWLASNQLRKLVWNYKTAEIEVEAARSALQKSQSLQNKVQQKVQAGESPQIDLLLANKATSVQQNQLIKPISA